MYRNVCCINYHRCTIKCIWLQLGVCMIKSIEYGDLRISGGSNYGRLEFREKNDTWGIVCRTGFNANAAVVACQQLGYNSGHAEYYYHG